jgi:hypothetical protein
VALHSIACPECGARVKSSKGFKRGQDVSCPKCETDFSVDNVDSTDESPDTEWSYKNSWIRYAVLGVLVVVLGVLGYMLYEKKRAAKETDTVQSDDEIPMANPKLVGKGDPGLRPIGRSGGGGAGVGQPKGNSGEAKDASPDRESIRKQLTGSWEAARNDEKFAIEYKPDGSFTYSVDGKAKKSIEGRWKMAGIEPVKTAQGTRNLIAWVQMEWVPEGQEAMTGKALYNELGTLTHPLLDRGAGEKRPTAVFNRKN